MSGGKMYRKELQLIDVHFTELPDTHIQETECGKYMWVYVLVSESVGSVEMPAYGLEGK